MSNQAAGEKAARVTGIVFLLCLDILFIAGTIKILAWLF